MNACFPPTQPDEATTSFIAASDKHYAADGRCRPGVFLMTDSFETGGSERQFAALARSVDPSSFRMLLGCIQRRGAFLESLPEVRQIELGGSLYGFRSLRARLLLARQLRAESIAVAHAFDFYTNLTLIPAAWFAGTPVVIGSQRQLGDLLGPAQRRAQAAVFRLCDRVVCNSRAAADRLIEGGLPERRIAIIGNGLPPAAFASVAPAVRRRAGGLRVGMIARMNARSKNHSLFLQMASRLLSLVKNIEFVLVGDGPLRRELEGEAASLGLGGRVLFLGDRRDIPEILASIDVAVLPSSSESLSNAILEAMAAGVPVVASQVGGNVELLASDRGVMVADGDGAGFAAAVASLLNDASRREAFSAKARDFALANCSLDVMRTRHQDLYMQLLEQKGWQARRKRMSSPSKDNRVRVAIVAASLRYVGGQSCQADLMERNWRDDTEVAARLIFIDPPFPPGLRWAEQIPILRTAVRTPLYLASLARSLRDTDIAHIFSASYWSFMVAAAPALLVARSLGKKTLIHYHSGEARDHLRRFRSARRILNGTDQLVVPSGYLVDVFKEFGLQARAVPNVIDFSQFVFRAREPLRPHLVCTRGFHPYYCVDVVVKAFAIIQRAFPDARLDLLGAGPTEVQVRRKVQESKIAGVQFLGVASRQQIGQYYQQADIFINASRLDNMPVSILEAFASGTPVVSTAPEGMRYLVDDERTGLLSPPGNAEMLAQNVIRLLRDPDLASRLARNAYLESQRFRWVTIRQQWLNVYRSLSDKKGALSAAA